MGQHGAVVDVHHRQHHDHHQRQQTVVVPRDLLDEHLDAVDGVGLYIAGYRRRPRGHWGDHAHRGRRGVDEVGQLGTGNLVALGDGPHHSAHRQAVEVVVDEDQHAQQHGQQLCGAPGLYGLGGPASEGLRSAALVHQIHHDAQRHQKDDDAHVAAVGQHGDDTVVCAHQRHNGVPWGKLGVQQSAHQTPQKQGRVDLLADQGQHDGHDGRQQGPEGTGKGRVGQHRLPLYLQRGQGRLPVCKAQHHQQNEEYTDGCKVCDFCAFLFHCVIRPPYRIFRGS